MTGKIGENTPKGFKVAENKKFGSEIFFDTEKQYYTVYKDNKPLITGKYKYSEVKCYVDIPPKKWRLVIYRMIQQIKIFFTDVLWKGI